MMTGSIFLFSLLNEKSLAVLLITSITLSVNTAIGYFFVQGLEKSYVLNSHKAILLPWISATLFLLILNVLVGLSVNFLLTVPLFFVFASIGGSRAHYLKITKEF